MPTAHIITRFPERAAPLRKTLADAGYRVEVLKPGQKSSRAADLVYDLDAAPQQPASTPDPQQPPAQTPPPKPIQREARESHFGSQLRSLKNKISDSSRAFQEKIAQERAALAERNRARLAAQAEGHRLQEIETAEKRRIAETVAMERLKVEVQKAAEKAERERRVAEAAQQRAALELREQQEHEAKREAQIKLQMEQRRRDQQDAQRQAQLAADQRARLEAERRLQAARQSERASREEQYPMAPVAASPAVLLSARIAGAQRSLREASGHLRQRWDRVSVRVASTIRAWRELSPTQRFASTRDYAWHQAIPVAAGVALAFVFGWALASGNVQRTAQKQPAPIPPKNTVTNATPVAAVAITPVHTAKPLKPSPVAHKNTTSKGKHPVSRSRRPQADQEIAADDGDDVTVVHHNIKRDGQLAATKKAGVKTISDLE